MKQSSRGRLTPFTATEFPGSTLFDSVGRAMCEASCLPRKELFESWAVAKRVHRRLGGPWGPPVPDVTPTGGTLFDLAAGHGLLAWMLLLLDPTLEGAVCVDKRRPVSAGRVEAAMAARWPRLAGRVRWIEAPVQEVAIPPGALVASVHACSTLTDLVLDAAIGARARVAVLPCCQSLGRSDMGGLDAWVEGPLAVDIMRVARLRAAGYDVHLQRIPEEITPKNRLILGRPAGDAAATAGARA